MAWPVSPLGELDVWALPHRRVDKPISSARARLRGQGCSGYTDQGLLLSQAGISKYPETAQPPKGKQRTGRPKTSFAFQLGHV